VSLATILIHGPFWGLALVVTSGGAAASLGALAAVVVARVAMSAVMIVRVLRLPALARDLWLVPLKDLIMTAVYFGSLASRRVLWAGRRFEILRGGVMREVGG
jgi:hypothetical protein